MGANETINQVDLCFILGSQLQAGGAKQIKFEPMVGVGKCRADMRCITPDRRQVIIEIKCSSHTGARYMESAAYLAGMISTYGPSCIPLVVMYSPKSNNESWYRSVHGFKNLCYFTHRDLSKIGKRVLEYVSTRALSAMALAEMLLLSEKTRTPCRCKYDEEYHLGAIESLKRTLEAVRSA